MLRDQLKSEMMQAMKAKNTLEKNILRVALGEVQTAEARSGATLNNDAVVKILRKLVKSIGESRDAASGDEKGRLGQEIDILRRFLPQTLGIEQIQDALKDVHEQIRTADNDGMAMGVAMKLLNAAGATVDGKDVSAAVRAIRTP